MSSDEIVCDFERRRHHVVHNLKICDSRTLCRNFSSHCKSFYGCKILISICHMPIHMLICPICMFHGTKLFVMFLDCLV